MSLSRSTSRRYYIENLGCAKNQVDAEIMIAALDSAGWERCDDPDDATHIVVNSCGFIEPAKQESIDTALQFAAHFPTAKIIMAGCLSERYPGELADEMPELAAVVGNRAPGRIAEFLEALEDSPARIFVPTTPGPRPARRTLLSLPGSAYVKVAEGCDNRCSFCAIPLIRGGLRSRHVEEIVTEVRALLDQGIFEINLVAQDLAAFGRDTGENLGQLLRELLRDSRPFWIRMLYVYPEHFPEEVLDMCRSDARLLPYFDLPFQHAARNVLRRMGRSSTAERNLELIHRIRGVLPHVFLRSTLLVGFYGETEREFEELLEFQESAALDWLGVFPYSPEEGTPAESFDGVLHLPGADVAAARVETIRARQELITERRVDRLVGRDVDVLVEEMVTNEPLAIGRSYAHAPEVDGSVVLTLPEPAQDPCVGPVRPGEVVRCRVLRRNGLDVEAAPL